MRIYPTFQGIYINDYLHESIVLYLSSRISFTLGVCFNVLNINQKNNTHNIFNPLYSMIQRLAILIHQALTCKDDYIRKYSHEKLSTLSSSISFYFGDQYDPYMFLELKLHVLNYLLFVSMFLKKLIRFENE